MPQAPAKVVVVADDTAAVRERFQSALEQAGHRAILVATADELLACLRDTSAQIDLIVLDFGLPGTTGIDLVRSVQALAEGRLPILVFSGTIEGAEQVRDLAALGVDGYVNEHSASQFIVPALAPYLFPDSFNRRSGTRVVLSIPVQYRFGNTIAGALALNLGHGGIAIRTTTPLDSGSKVKVRFHVPGSKRDIDADGRVAWSDRRLGMGIQFEQVDAAGQALIDHFVDAHASLRKS